jgi:CheY-like chemotaxis protein
MTPSTTARVRQFSFQAQELPRKLAGFVPQVETGYWQLQFDRLSERKRSAHWNLGVSNGRVLYADSQPWTSQTLLKVVQRYVPNTRQKAVKSYISQLQSEGKDQVLSPAQLIAQLKQNGFLDEVQLLEALRLKVLNDLDTYCLVGSGLAEFISDQSLLVQLPVRGFEVESLIGEVMNRQFLWRQLKKQIPSMNATPTLDWAALKRSSLPAVQQAHVQNWVQSGKTLHNIAIGLAKDPLEIAKIFAKLVDADIVQLEPATQSAPSTIMIIDDSPLVLKQFQHWVTALGYPVVACQDAEAALQTILQVNPAAIFIDINMPKISGFELTKQIRQKPQLSEIPLVILTGEQKLSNKWRAQWSGCDFLTKPLSMPEVGLFQERLLELLQRLMTDSTSSAVA